MRYVKKQNNWSIPSLANIHEQAKNVCRKMSPFSCLCLLSHKQQMLLLVSPRIGLLVVAGMLFSNLAFLQILHCIWQTVMEQSLDVLNEHHAATVATGETLVWVVCQHSCQKIWQSPSSRNECGLGDLVSYGPTEEAIEGKVVCCVTNEWSRHELSSFEGFYVRHYFRNERSNSFGCFGLMAWNAVEKGMDGIKGVMGIPRLVEPTE